MSERESERERERLVIEKDFESIKVHSATKILLRWKFLKCSYSKFVLRTLLSPSQKFSENKRRRQK